MKLTNFRLPMNTGTGTLVFALLCLSLGLVCGYRYRPSIKAVDSIIVIESRRFALDSCLVRAIVLTESSGRRHAVSVKGALGLMQLMPGTAKQLATDLKISLTKDPDKILQPEINIRLGCYYLHLLLRRFHGDLYLTLAAYNTGPSRVHSWLNRHRHLAGRQVIAGCASRETRGFVRNVMQRYLRFCEEKL